ncbi:MAG: hypothetical protein DRJ37_00700 [Thermoprotei archaeon]|nr:MAG: hypothetical protein DRJ37_00700 [Thermoprotei archaeon]
MLKSFELLKKQLAKIENEGKDKIKVRLKRRSIRIDGENNFYLEETLDVKEYMKIITSKSGKLVFNEDAIYVYPLEKNLVWGTLAPIVELPETQEIFVRGDRVWATIGGKRFKVYIKNFEPEKTINKLVIKSGAQIDYSKPQSEAEIDGWRLYFKLPLISGDIEMTATKIVSTPRLYEIVDPILAARLLTIVLKPSVVAIVGPAGSGKTTLLSSLLKEMIAFFPHLRISIIEQVREICIENASNIAYSKAGPNTSITMLIRQSMRYERPDILVLGELRGEEIWSWVEAGRLGIAALTTYHSPDAKKAVFSMAELMRQNIHDATIETVMQLIDCIIVMKKFLIGGAIRREVEGVYFTYDDKLIAIYKRGIHASEEKFKSFFSERIMVGDFNMTYQFLKRKIQKSEL